MANPTVEIKVEGPNLLARKVWIDGVQVTIGGNGVARKSVAPNKDHGLQFAVRGPKGAEWSVAITDPTSAAYAWSGTLDSSGLDHGGGWFNVEIG